MAGGFIYANGRVSAEETELLDGRMWQMLMSAGDEEEVLRLLGDTWYGSFMQYHSMEECFLRAMEATEEELLELSEDQRLVRGILHRRDVRNARYIWKNAIFRADAENRVEVERPGLLDIDTLKTAVFADQARDDLPPLFSDALEDLLKMDTESHSAFDRRMDELAAQVELEELTKIAPDFRDFVKTRMEQKNFLIAGRCALDEVPAQEIEEMLLPGGFHSPEEVAGSYQRGTLLELMAETSGFEELVSAFGDGLESGSFNEFQRKSDAMLLEKLQKGAFPVFGPSPLAAFVIRRELEIRHLKLLLAAKSAGVGQDRLKKRLPRG